MACLLTRVTLGVTTGTQIKKCRCETTREEGERMRVSNRFIVVYKIYQFVGGDAVTPILK